MPSVLIENISNVALPGPKMEKPDLQKMWSLQTRAHLTYHDDKTKRDPLDELEVEQLAALEEKFRDQQLPKWGPLKFKFAAKGKPGSVWRCQANQAQVLLAEHPTRLRVLEYGDQPKVKPLEQTWAPTIAEMTPGSTTEEASHAATRIGGDGRIVKGGEGWMTGARTERIGAEGVDDSPAGNHD